MKPFAFRLPAYLVERIDRFAKGKAKLDGRPCSRSDALRLLLEEALAQHITGLVLAPPGEVIKGKVTDSFEPPPKKKKKTSIDAYAAKRAAAFEEAKKKRPGV